MESRIVILYKIREAIFTRKKDRCLLTTVFFAVKHDQQHLNLQIACSTAMQSASAFRKESFPQSRSSCSRTFARESAV